MGERIDKKELIQIIAKKMNENEETAELWLDTILDSMYETFKSGKGLTLKGFGGFYLDRRRNSTVFKFNPSQKLKKLLGWSSSYKGKL